VLSLLLKNPQKVLALGKSNFSKINLVD